jgi:predicted nucleotidyltransferase
MYLNHYHSQLSTLCGQYNVKSLYAFGSVLTEQFNNNSDVDLIVAFNDIPVEEYADNYFDFKFSLQDIFNRPVDLLEEQAIKNPYFRKKIDTSKQIIYCNQTYTCLENRN